MNGVPQTASRLCALNRDAESLKSALHILDPYEPIKVSLSSFSIHAHNLSCPSRTARRVGNEPHRETHDPTTAHAGKSAARSGFCSPQPVVGVPLRPQLFRPRA